MKEEIIEINKLKVSYIHSGEGRTILILHGWNSSSYAWGEVAKLLAERGFSVFVPDLPGFGGSSTPQKPWGINEYAKFIVKFAETGSLGKFILIGHSFGGQIAIRLSSLYPNRVERLILCAPAAIRHKKRLKVRIFYLFAKVGNVIFSLPFIRLLRNKLRKVLYFTAREKDYLRAGKLEGTMKKVISEDMRPYLKEIKHKTLILWGDKDIMVPVSDAYTIQKEIRNSKVTVITDANHKFPYERVKEFTHEVLSFLS